MKYRTLKAALHDLAEIDDWVKEHFGESFAFDTEHELFETFELLTRFPQMGVEKRDISGAGVRFFLHQPYWISYSPRRATANPPRLPLRPRPPPNRQVLTPPHIMTSGH